MGPEQRLSRRADFDAVFKDGFRTASGPLLVRARRRDAAFAERPCRYGYAISSRLDNAVVRNRIRRRLRASARHLKGADACRGLDVVVIARTGAPEADYAQLDSTLRRLIRRSMTQLGMTS